MPDGARIGVYFIVVSALRVEESGSQRSVDPVRAHLVGLVPEEMYFFKALVCDVLQGVGLVPSVGEDVERDLPADGVGEPVVGEFILQDFDERGSEPVLLGRSQ